MDPNQGSGTLEGKTRLLHHQIEGDQSGMPEDGYSLGFNAFSAARPSERIRITLQSAVLFSAA